MTAIRLPVPLLAIRSRRLTRPAVALTALISTSIVVRTFAAWPHSTARYFPDEYIYAQLGHWIGHGQLHVRDQPAHFPAILGPLLAAPIWRLFPLQTAYHLVQVENVVGASLAAVPIYLLARYLRIGQGWSFACAVYAIVIPMLTMTPFIVTDFIAYPFALAAITIGVKALDEPTARRQWAFLAYATLATLARTEYCILVPAYLAAAVLLERRSFFRRHRVAALAIVPIGLALVVAGTGFYSGIRHILLNTAILTWIPLQAYLLCLVAGVVIAPGAVAAVARPRDRREKAFALLVGATAIFLIVETSVYAASAGKFTERYLFALVPLIAVAFVVYVRRADRHKWIVFLLSVAIAIAAARLPVSAYATGAGRYDSQFLVALEWFQDRVGIGSSSLIVAALATVGALWAIVISFRSRGRLAVAFVIAVALTASAIDVHRDLRDSAAVRGSLPSDLQWIDHHARAPVTAIATPLSKPSSLFLQLFWNPGITKELALDDADPTDVYVKHQVQIGPDGRLLNVRGPFLFDDNGSSATFTGARLLSEQDDYALWQPAGVPRFRTLIEGIYPDHWLIPGGRIRAWPLSAGKRVSLRFTLTLPGDFPHKVTMRLGRRHFTLRPGDRRRITCTSRPGSSHLEFVYFSPDGSIDVLGRPLTLLLTGTRVEDTGSATAASGCVSS